MAPCELLHPECCRHSRDSARANTHWKSTFSREQAPKRRLHRNLSISAEVDRQSRRCCDSYWRTGVTLLKWALVFLVISIIAGLLGFTGISAASADIARILFYIFVVIFLILLILGLTIFRV
jgi:uncharacterized membrane protein YtjA (UPF0391 family)